ncbi:hypothetical protein L3X38_026070 [Prunus dulcis]|uniref:Uncharacterized protein n=1 Tax=Prunus dulcis TaxID=3755 RepID=A0AAD4W3M5_PRUDU|nr:hypothetical protein L3X38_026070 [Prunus dulcis]
MGILKLLSGFIVSLVDRDLLNQAHLYVLENTEEVLSYIEYEHMIHIKTTYPKFRKRTKWLQDKQNSTFIQWLHFKVYIFQSELNGEEHNGVLENLRWLAAGPSMAVPSYRSYLINGVKFNIKAQDDVRTIQNSGIYLLAHTMQVASAKDKNPIVSNMGFYGVIQEIWDLDYQKFRIPVLRKYNDVIGDDVLGDTRIECEPFTRGIRNVDTFDDLVDFHTSTILSALGWADAPPSRICFWELTEQLPRVVTHPGIAPASNSLNFGVPTTPKPVSSQKASPKFRVAQRTGPTPSSKILSSLGLATFSPARKDLFLGAHGATSQGVTHLGIAPASNSLNFGVPTNPKPVSSQKASPKIRVAQRTAQLHLARYSSNSLNFGVPTNPKPVSSQKASRYEDARCAI